MRHRSIYGATLVAACLLLSVSASAGKWNVADYPLRVHIFQFNSHSHYRYGELQGADGEGRGNLYQNGQPQGFDFGYQCGARIMVSPGFETYLARWRKAGRELEILLPTLGGKPGEMNACDLDVTLKQDTVYVKHNGLLSEEPATEYKNWMTRHQYDPEHGLDQPVKLEPGPAQPVATQ
ncbi:MAG TPA: hypothetical protein VGG45_12725 [Terracidiphilus sp.]|jgi:hypothetical protein